MPLVAVTGRLVGDATSLPTAGSLPLPPPAGGPVTRCPCR